MAPVARFTSSFTLTIAREVLFRLGFQKSFVSAVRLCYTASNQISKGFSSFGASAHLSRPIAVTQPSKRECCQTGLKKANNYNIKRTSIQNFDVPAFSYSPRLSLYSYPPRWCDTLLNFAVTVKLTLCGWIQRKFE